MKALEEKILKEGTVKDGGILKVDNFLNHQIDAPFLMEMGSEIKRLYSDCGVTKILTIEASGIAIAMAAAAQMGLPVLFAKKNRTKNISSDTYCTKVASFTHGIDYDVVVSKSYLTPEDTVLIVDDFLAHGNALEGLADLAKQAGASVAGAQAGAKIAGASCAIEKGFQGGGDRLRGEGMRIESLALIDDMSDGKITFR